MTQPGFSAGTYQAIITFPRFAEAGTWHASGAGIYMGDVIGN
jgi:hypothetical protein